MREYMDLDFSDFPERHQAFLEQAKKTKELSLAEGTETAPSLVEGWRDDEAVITMVCAPDRDKMLFSVQTQLAAFGCEWVFASYETWHTSSPVNPKTGEPWRQGEMQFLVENYGEENAVHHWVVDALTTMSVSRTGRVIMSTSGFTQRDGKVTWLEDYEGNILTDSENDAVDGSVYDYIKHVTDALREDDRYRKGREMLEMAGVVLDDEARERMIAKLDSKVALTLLTDFLGDEFGLALSAEPDSVRAETLDSEMRRIKQEESGVTVSVTQPGKDD